MAVNRTPNRRKSRVDDGIRTRDVQIHSTTVEGLSRKFDGTCGDDAEILPQILPNDPDLAQLVTRWDSLPADVRRAVLTLTSPTLPRRVAAAVALLVDVEDGQERPPLRVVG